MIKIRTRNFFVQTITNRLKVNNIVGFFKPTSNPEGQQSSVTMQATVSINTIAIHNNKHNTITKTFLVLIAHNRDKD